MKLFYQKNIDLSKSNFILNEIDSKHAIKVMRLKIDNTIHIMNGEGGLIKGKIIDDNPKKALIEIIETTIFENENSPSLHIAIAPTKNNDRLEWFLEKATEIGISEITPIICDNSERKTVKIERLEKIIVSASKQSLQYHKPILNEAKTLKQVLEQNNLTNNLIAHCYEGGKTPLINADVKKDTLILIGPEGDFSKKEVELAIDKFNFKPISLGKSRLRTETAGIVACHSFKLSNTLL